MVLHFRMKLSLAAKQTKQTPGFTLDLLIYASSHFSWLLSFFHSQTHVLKLKRLICEIPHGIGSDLTHSHTFLSFNPSAFLSGQMHVTSHERFTLEASSKCLLREGCVREGCVVFINFLCFFTQLHVTINTRVLRYPLNFSNISLV